MQRIGYAVFPGFQVMSFAALSVFEFANIVAEETIYELEVISEHGGWVKSSTGLALETAPLGNPRFDTLIIGGGVTIDPGPEALVKFVRKAMKVSRRVASICTGAVVLAQAGILDGRRATTHWNHARALQRQYPKMKMEEDRIFIVDGSVWTSAGMSAGIDLALAMVEKDLGAELARTVAKYLVVYHRRSGGQSQYSALLEMQPKSDRIQSALAYAKQNLHTPLSVDQLAEAAHLSTRQFSRAFRSETGQSPAKAVENLRVEAARVMMEQGRLSIDVVARETGFADRDRMRRAFLRAYGQPPQVIRRNARVGAAA
ncbi:MAG: AraC family transcriptional regulator [Nevskia sp.]|nr:AraC family transcriptional regulator [Nevskia sp.]